MWDFYIMEGWIKLHRKFIDWEWFQDKNMVHLFLYLLLSANHKDNKWQGVDIKRGQLITGINKLNEKTKISIQSIRTCLSKLKSTGEITIEPTSKYSIITIFNYDSYQTLETATNKQNNKESTSDQQTTNKQLTTNNNEKKDKNVKNNMDVRKSKFYSLLVPYVSEYNNTLVKAFYDYWTEPNKSKSKMKFELQQTWDLNLRLKNWAGRNKDFEKNNSEEKLVGRSVQGMMDEINKNKL